MSVLRMVQEHIRLSLNIAYELTRQKNVGEKIDFDTLPYTLARISLFDKVGKPTQTKQ